MKATPLSLLSLLPRPPLLPCLLASAALLAGCASPLPLPAQPPDGHRRAAPQATAFADWLRSVGDEAIAAGLRPERVRQALGQAELLPRVIELDRAQPEFTRQPWTYLDNAVSPQRIAQGRAALAAQQPALQAAAQRYGVPAAIVTAIWGVESNYGQNFGSFSTLSALATLGFEGRRQAWARRELLAALTIIDQGDIAPERMIGSWAGAMGHTQFLPSVYLAYAVDADGDGRRDIWASVADVAASTAHYLARSGWRADEPTLVELQLPPDFDWQQADPAVRQDSGAWARAGLRGIDASALPPLADASVLAPAGAQGPALLVGANFRALLRYNNAVNYALAVALLARQIEGGSGLHTPWPRSEPALSRPQVQALQTALNALGLQAGAADGLLGPATSAALRRYQRSQGLTADGFATRALLERLTASAP